MAGECKFKTIVLEVTETCNHGCLHCYRRWPLSPHQGRRSELSRAEIRDLVRKVKSESPLEQVALSGGEPMLRLDLPEIVCDLADEGLATVVITNGSYLTPQRLSRFPSGSVFEVTLFSPDHERHDRMAGCRSFQRTLEGIARLRKHEMTFVLALLVTKENACETGRTIELGIALGAEAVLLNRVNLSRASIAFASDLVPDPLTLQRSLDQAEEAAEKYGIAVAVSVPVPPCLVDPERYSHLHFGWCPRGNDDAYYTIGPEGWLRPCNHSSVVLGDLREKRFSELVLGRKAQAFWVSIPAQCAACDHPLAGLCRGGCPAASDECYGSPDHPDPFVEISQRMRETTVST